MKEKSPAHPDAPKAAHLPARGMETGRKWTGAPDPMARWDKLLTPPSATGTISHLPAETLHLLQEISKSKGIVGSSNALPTLPLGQPGLRNADTALDVALRQPARTQLLDQ